MIEKIYKTFLWIGLASLIVFTPVARGAVRIWSITVVLFIESILIFVWLLKINNTGRYGLKRTDADVPIALFVILGVTSLFFSVYRHDSFYAILELLGYVGVFYLVINEFDGVMVKRLIRLIIGLGSALGLYGLLQYFGALNHPWWVPKDFLASTYVNHNHFAGFLELVIPVTMAMSISLKNRRLLLQSALILALVIMVPAFILTQSRGAWVSLVVSFFAMGIIFLRRRTLNAMSVFLFLLMAIIVFSFLYFGKETISQRMSSIAQGEAQEASAEIRLMIWRGSIGMIANSPITGTGIGTFIHAFPPFRPAGLNVQANFAHNDYLQAAAEMGIAAPFVIVWFLITVLRAAAKDVDLDPLKLGCAIGVMSLSLHGLVDFNFHIPANMLLFTVYASVILKKDLYRKSR